MYFIFMLGTCFLSCAYTQSVDTTHGEVTGLRTQVLGKAIDVFYGIPFAKPPLGSLRFKHPEPLDPWRPEVKDTRVMKASCQQKIADSSAMPWRTIPPLLSEDCLYINAWVPANVNANTKLTTMVWIYGGSFTTGSINSQLTNGQYLAAEQNVIVMAINYRLGALGTLYMGPDTFPGNQGMMDQVLAMKWIYNNVERFGGDQKSITLFGESAGAVAVGHHLVSPLSRDYFTRAILESGSTTCPWGSGSKSFAKSSMLKLSRGCGCFDTTDAELYNCMKDIPSGTLLDKQDIVIFSDTNVVPFGPVVDGVFLPDTPATLVETGQLKDTEILIGTNKDEGTFFLLGTLPTIFLPQNEISVSKSQFQLTLNRTLGSTLSMSKAITAQYEGTKLASNINYADISDDMLGDNLFKCPIVTLANGFAKKNAVYLYSFEHALSAIPLPKWLGAAHTFDLEFVFGVVLGDEVNGTPEEVTLTRLMMQYWTQFAKTGNPNLPDQPATTWPQYDAVSEQYLVLDLPGAMTTRQGLRKQECVFWNTIVPIITDTCTSEKGSGDTSFPSSASTKDAPLVTVWASAVSAVVVIAVRPFFL